MLGVPQCSSASRIAFEVAIGRPGCVELLLTKPRERLIRYEGGLERSCVYVGLSVSL